MILEWKENFSVNNKDIDEQHKKLFEIGQRIYDSISTMNSYDRYDEIMEIFSELNEYVKFHFKFEEELLEECGYSKLETHKMEHHFFMKKLEREANRDIESSQKETLVRLINFIADWIVQHILKEDMAYKESLMMKR
ncbi:bacteriohemerythrin [Pseudobacteroides cellulosolvens]|uniref:Hemerythrin-like metal-binding protein n=1 Tax=Pseudobacteroides cellulosolvens ATCC 35603 = DSM 2933 TaxID=398512 RepID=A0A0L6JHV5_9FIRM|nr:hemerythrin family protein [Pseudobacteroides cellulosolvens]KNY25298.1 hemerythrin-like metal-binding protein [Pseudobacteroides cellulosolvens ATCC 35603 = DSM 2933]